MAAFALWSMTGPSVVRADWGVHRSPSAASEQLVRIFTAHPERRDLAVRLLRGRSGADVARLLGRFETAAANRPADFQAQLAHAQLLLAARRWEPAAVGFERAAGIAPQSLAARWGRARALAGAARPADARTELRAALALSRTSTDIQQLARELIISAASVGDAEAELEGRRALVAVRPSAREVFDLAAAVNGAGKPGEAARVLSERGRDFRLSQQEMGRWDLAEGKYRAADGDLDGAAQALARAIRATPRTALGLREEVWTTVVDVARRRGSLDEVARELSSPVDAVDWVARARIADEQGDLRGAWKAIAEAVRLSPRNVALRKREIALARRVGTPNQVVELHERLAAFALRSGDPALMVDALDGLWDMHREEAAAGAVDRVLASGQRAAVSMLRALGEAAGRWGDDRRAERCWSALLRRTPHDELALVALGEVQLQRGQRRLAVETWRTVARGGARDDKRAEGHARLAEILVDHDFQEQALSEARLAVTLRPVEPRYHRLLATILERQARLAAAEAEWETVLRLTRGSAQAPARHEARMRLVGLWIRAGNARVEMKLREMEEAVVRDKRDSETLLFLVQAQVRTGRTEAALALMQRTLEDSDEMAAATHPSDDDAELILLLVRTLRQLHRTDEAMRWLEQLSRRFPGRAREARLQLAELAMAEHADGRAEEYAEQAATSAAGQGRTLLRAAAVQERLGHSDQAAAVYRRLLDSANRDAAGLALASLLARRGEIDEQRALLRDILRDSDDEEMAVSAGNRAIVLEEASGGLESLEAFVANLPDLNGATAVAVARRRVLAAILWRVVPDAYRSQSQEPSAAAKLNQFARHGARALLELADAPDAAPDARAIEVLGMLGRADAVPALARLLVPGLGDRQDARAPAASPSSSQATSGPPFTPNDDLAAATVVALGRLGGDLARRALEMYAEHTAPGVRVALLWALGRVGGAVAVQHALRELDRNATDAAVVACLSLGRAGTSGEGEARLVEVAEDPRRPTLVRVAGVLGLGLGRRQAATPVLRRLSATADPELAGAARASLRFLDGSSAIPDDGAAILGSHIDAEALLSTLQGSAIVVPAWRPEISASPGPRPRPSRGTGLPDAP